MNVTQDLIIKEFGVVIVDVRPAGTPVSRRVLPFLQELRKTAPSIPCEVWITPGSVIPVELQSFFTQEATASITLRYMPSNYTSSAGNTLDLHSRHGGHIGKALALRDSSFQYSVLLDGDSWPCPGWLESVKNTTREVDVVWTLAPSPFGDLPSNTHVSPSMRDEDIKNFTHFHERNTGTVFAVLKSPATNRWLTDALDLRALQSTQEHLEKYRTEWSNWEYKDQPAFRESYFLHRRELSEYIYPNSIACRDGGGQLKGCQCMCNCSSCLFLHGRHPFDQCAATLSR